MTEYYIKMKDLAVGYQGNALISDINLKIKKGEIVTLIGPNGAGKSTILKSITRQLKLIGGEVYIDSEESVNFLIKRWQLRRRDADREDETRIDDLS